MKKTILAALAILIAGTSASFAVDKLKVAVPQQNFVGVLLDDRELEEVASVGMRIRSRHVEQVAEFGEEGV